MNEQELIQFVEWLSSNIDEFKNKKPEEVVTALNKMSQTEEGMNTISGLINQFKKNSTGMFKKGGKLDQLINKFKRGDEIHRNSSSAFNKHKVLQSKFHAKKFEDGGETERHKSTIKKASNGKTYTIDVPDTLNGYVVRRISRQVGDDAYNVTSQVYKVGEPNNAKYFWTTYPVTGGYLETLRQNPLKGKSNPSFWNKRKDLAPLYNELYK